MFNLEFKIEYMSFMKFLQKTPLVFKTDPITHVGNLMLSFSLPEIPVVDEKKLLGTITSKKLGSIEMEAEELLAYHLLEKDFIRIDQDANLKDLVSSFQKKRKCIACIFDGRSFKGYVQRKNLLKLLFNSKEKVEKFVSQNFISVDLDESLKKIIKLSKKDLPILILENEKPCAAFSPEELSFVNFINRYLTKKFERDFETLRAGERKFLRLRLNQQLLRYLKEEKISPPYFHLLSLRCIVKPFVFKKKTVGEAAKTMLKLNKTSLATQEGIVSDLDLLKVLV